MISVMLVVMSIDCVQWLTYRWNGEHKHHNTDETTGAGPVGQIAGGYTANNTADVEHYGQECGLRTGNSRIGLRYVERKPIEECIADQFGEEQTD